MVRLEVVGERKPERLRCPACGAEILVSDKVYIVEELEEGREALIPAEMLTSDKFVCKCGKILRTVQ